MRVIVRQAVAADLEELLPAFLEMERHYDEDSAIDVSTAKARLRQALASGEGVLLLASGAQDNAPMGFLSMFTMFPGPGLRSVWFMKELYVVEAARSHGAGEALVTAAARIVLDRGGERLDFTTGRDNAGAQKFYARIGAREAPSILLRLDGQALSRLATDAG